MKPFSFPSSFFANGDTVKFLDTVDFICAERWECLTTVHYLTRMQWLLKKLVVNLQGVLLVYPEGIFVMNSVPYTCDNFKILNCNYFLKSFFVGFSYLSNEVIKEYATGNTSCYTNKWVFIHYDDVCWFHITCVVGQQCKHFTAVFPRYFSIRTHLQKGLTLPAVQASGTIMVIVWLFFPHPLWCLTLDAHCLVHLVSFMTRLQNELWLTGVPWTVWKPLLYNAQYFVGLCMLDYWYTVLLGVSILFCFNILKQTNQLMMFQRLLEELGQGFFPPLGIILTAFVDLPGCVWGYICQRDLFNIITWWMWLDNSLWCKF